mmetsp:Transcript_129104/g.413738  ORF Transcript_129104/g.413738 Transcript_129104/m.413738 type:complete len:238 (+) Transcript_129104:959-1672(+)
MLNKQILTHGRRISGCVPQQDRHEHRPGDALFIHFWAKLIGRRLHELAPLKLNTEPNLEVVNATTKGQVMIPLRLSDIQPRPATDTREPAILTLAQKMAISINSHLAFIADRAEVKVRFADVDASRNNDLSRVHGWPLVDLEDQVVGSPLVSNDDVVPWCAVSKVDHRAPFIQRVPTGCEENGHRSSRLAAEVVRSTGEVDEIKLARPVEILSWHLQRRWPDRGACLARGWVGCVRR